MAIGPNDAFSVLLTFRAHVPSLLAFYTSVFLLPSTMVHAAPAAGMQAVLDKGPDGDHEGHGAQRGARGAR